MVMPNLREVFFDNDFTEETTPELEENEERFNEAITSSGLINKVYNEICEAKAGAVAEAQYLGFSQGFRWAVYLLTGYNGTGTASAEK